MTDPSYKPESTDAIPRDTANDEVCTSIFIL